MSDEHVDITLCTCIADPNQQDYVAALTQSKPLAHIATPGTSTLTQLELS
jgi:hypothetical protein